MGGGSSRGPRDHVKTVYHGLLPPQQTMAVSYGGLCISFTIGTILRSHNYLHQSGLADRMCGLA